MIIGMPDPTNTDVEVSEEAAKIGADAADYIEDFKITGGQLHNFLSQLIQSVMDQTIDACAETCEKLKGQWQLLRSMNMTYMARGAGRCAEAIRGE